MVVLGVEAKLEVRAREGTKRATRLTHVCRRGVTR